MLGDQLARARDAIGYAQEDVAKALGVTRTMISYWESGKRRPNDRQLAALAGLYAVEVASLLAEQGELHADLAEMLLRSTAAKIGATARHGIEGFVAFLDAYADLSDATGVAIRGLMQSPFSLVRGYDSGEDERRKAEEVRAHLRLGIGPIGDVDVVCEMLGVAVYRAALGKDLDTSISGAFLKHPRVGLSILVNLEMTPGRRRFTIAHELAHALFHSDQRSFVVSRPGDGPLERFANAFAGEFLMPTEGIRRAMEEHGIGPRIDRAEDVVHLQRFFRVSYATALYRLRQAKLIGPTNFEAFKQVQPVLFAQQLGYEPSDEELEQDVERWSIRRFPPKFLLMLRTAIRKDVVSIPTASAITSLSIDEIEDLLRDEVPVDPGTREEMEDFRAADIVDA